ncbi:hypothetical protein Hypma_011000 [Hypsizygus marmoreus]|uniref:Uncharacterized protein n=1 Tax=Hypsizygus marmoreus TaxID=39966 RepID=A0A369JKY1_HYPMA|nr:hypothetical protein Hypma_011000 [Hypsizygus marmoreus]
MPSHQHNHASFTAPYMCPCVYFFQAVSVQVFNVQCLISNRVVFAFTESVAYTTWPQAPTKAIQSGLIIDGVTRMHAQPFMQPHTSSF